MKALTLPDVGGRLAQLALQPVGGTPQLLAAVIKSEIERWSKVAQDLGIEPQ